MVKRIIREAYQVPIKYEVRFQAARISLSNSKEDIKRHRVYLLYVDNKPIGTVTIKRLSFGCEISHLAVLPYMQVEGWGKWLLRFTEREICKLGRKRAFLFTSEDHPWLSRFYQKNGYRRVNIRRSSFTGIRMAQIYCRGAHSITDTPSKQIITPIQS
ncbi:GNAT family N-acetyltransferase [Effusibacillus consociatus]|uniref:GNAT family N-acetyltransferase n=1 Tax=Effusibacillus consociatus TaxID=1117041 RepID=A0ABV9Q646_9BACL